MANRQVGVLWARTSQKGTQFLSGTVSMGVFGECPVVIFRVADKRTDNSPDYVIYASTPQRQNGATAEGDEAPIADDKDLPF